MRQGGIRGDICGIGRALAQPVTYLGVALLAFIYCALAYFLITDRRDAYNDAVLRGGNLVHIVEQSYSHIFRTVDATLIFLRKLYQQSPAAFDLAGSAANPATPHELAFEYVITDAAGRIASSSFSNAMIGADLSGQECFRFHANSAVGGVSISKPAISKYTGRWVVVVSRRIVAPDGKFAGIIAAFVDLAQIEGQISSLDAGEGGAVVLAGLDGIIRARAIDGKFDWTAVGRELPATANLFAKVARAKSGHFWNDYSVVDKVKRLISYRVLDPLPLVAVVALSEAEVYRRANENARIYYSSAALLTLVIVIAIGVGVFRERKLVETTVEMKHAQDEIKRGQERYALIERAVTDGIWDRNMVTGECYYSPSWRRILGYDDDEVPCPASSWHQLIHPDDRASVLEALRAHLANDIPYAMEYRVRCKNGDHRWVQSRGRAMRDPASGSVRMVGTITDIHERKQTEALVEESRSNLERAERMALLGHYKIEKASKQLIWSEGVYRIFGKSPASFTPTLKAALGLLNPDDRPALEQYRHDAMEGVERAPVTLRAIRDDGQAIYIENWLVPVRASDGTVTGVFGTIQDITARKRAEEALARANQELETRVAERTAALAEEMRRREEAQMKLAHMQKMKVVGQLTAGMAHDFNNLLAVIRGSLEFVERAAARGLSADPDLIDAAVRATRRGSELVQRLLAFSRQSPLRAEPTVIDQLVLDTLRLLQRTLGAQVDIMTHLDATAAAVSVDRNQLANALVNLALNARDAMPGGGQLTIATTCQPAPPTAVEGSAGRPSGDEVCITISDTGSGMPKEVRDRVFEPFFTTKPDGLGSGLGLSMVQGFVEQSGGSIEIDSAVGHGTTITIRLPKIAAIREADATDAASGPSATGKEKTVLLVEDDPDVRVVTAAQLRQLGYTVRAVANGNEAIDLIESPAQIDVTLTDIVLPGGIDGVTLVKEAMRARPGMGVLCMSGYDPTQQHHKWLKVQNIEFLEKPFSSHRLARALDALFV